MKAILQILLVSLLSLSLTAPLSAGSSMGGVDLIEVRILSHVSVDGEEYSLGQIAELDGFDIEAIQELAGLRMGRSPLPGKSLPITQSMIKAKLNRVMKANQYKLKMAKKTKITRSYSLVSAKEIKTKLKATILEKFKNYDEVKINLKTRIKDQMLPKGKANFAINQIGKSEQIGGWSSWRVSLNSDGKEHKQILVRAKIDVVDEVTVAKSRIKKGSKIGKQDLITVKKDISKEKRGYQPAADMVVGQQAKRDIHRMESLKPELVEEPVIVQKGSPIRIVYQSKSLYLTNLGVAMKSARRGDMIPVRTLRNKTTVYAIIKDAKTAEVAL